MEIGKIKIFLDKDWELRDLSIMTKEYVQLYSFFYVISRVSEGMYVDLDFSKYPWGGGYSVINFFQKSYGLTDREHKLQISRIQYASPGFIELTGVLGVAADVATLVTTLCGSAFAVNKTYDGIVSSYHKRKLGNIKIKEAEFKLTKDNIDFIHSSVKTLGEYFNLRPEQVMALKKISNKNELVQLKVLLALYRRASPIVKQQKSGNTRL